MLKGQLSNTNGCKPRHDADFQGGSPGPAGPSLPQKETPRSLASIKQNSSQQPEPHLWNPLALSIDDAVIFGANPRVRSLEMYE